VGRIPEHRVEAPRNAVVLGMGLRPPGRGVGHAPPLSAHDTRVDETMGWVEGRGAWPTTEQQVGPRGVVSYSTGNCPELEYPVHLLTPSTVRLSSASEMEVACESQHRVTIVLQLFGLGLKSLQAKQ
jgi:hypothetical protein